MEKGARSRRGCSRRCECCAGPGQGLRASGWGVWVVPGNFRAAAGTRAGARLRPGPGGGPGAWSGPGAGQGPTTGGAITGRSGRRIPAGRRHLGSGHGDGVLQPSGDGAGEQQESQGSSSGSGQDAARPVAVRPGGVCLLRGRAGVPVLVDDGSGWGRRTGAWYARPLPRTTTRWGRGPLPAEATLACAAGAVGPASGGVSSA